MCYCHMEPPIKAIIEDDTIHSEPEEDEDSDVEPSPENRINCAYYINACFELPTAPGTSHEDNVRELPPEPLVHRLNHSPLAANWWVKTTPGGLLLAFNRPEDATTFFRMVNMAQLMKCPVQVAKIPHALPENHQVDPDVSPTQFLIIRDIPWSIPLVDVREALNQRGIEVSSIDRYRQHVRIELSDPQMSESLLHNGLNFFRIGRFPVTCLNKHNPQPANENDVTQCYRCQGFFHIASHCRARRQVPRCVRCGDSHYADTCPRPRSNAVCCNCTGAHHAAHKQCPIRQHLSTAIPVHFTLSIKRPLHSAAPIIQDPHSDTCRCLL